MKVIVSNEIEQVCPNFVGACVEAEVVNTTYSEGLWKEIHALEEQFRKELTTESLKQLSGIAATRRVYKACGKTLHVIAPHPKHLFVACCKVRNCIK